MRFPVKVKLSPLTKNRNTAMSWKKNVFSYLLWVVYAVAAEVGLVCLADAACDSVGIEIYVGTVACAVYVAAAGLGIYLLHRFVLKHPAEGGKKRFGRIAAETAVTVVLLTAGLVLRAGSVGGGAEDSPYYRMAVMVSEEELPVLDHGAVSVYVRMLHGLFYFLGNKPEVAVWTQILLQTGALLFLYFAVRRAAGSASAVVMLGFCMFSSYLSAEASALSPAMLYLFLWSAVLLLAVTAGGPGKSLWVFLAAGLGISLAGYLDPAGWLLLPVLAGVIFCGEREAAEPGGRLKRLLLCAAGAAVGLVCCFLVQCLMSGRAFTEVLAGWLSLYRPSGFKLPVSAGVPGGMGEYIVLFCVLTLGIFSFWRDGRRDYRKAWMILLALSAVAGCLGVFTEEVPMGLYIYLLLTVLAGIAAAECIRRVEPGNGAVPALAAGEAAMTVGEAAGAGEPGEQSGRETPPSTAAESGGQPEPAGGPSGKVRLIENPLPLPKKHVRKRLDYGMDVPAGKDDFDLKIDEKDDFDI